MEDASEGPGRKRVPRQRTSAFRRREQAPDPGQETFEAKGTKVSEQIVTAFAKEFKDNKFIVESTTEIGPKVGKTSATMP